MKAMVTGAAGFIGSHLAEYLVQKGFEVRAFIRYNSRNSWGWLDGSSYKDKIEVYTGDIRDFDSVRDAMKKIDVVFHLAALIGIPYSYVSALAYIKTNVEGTYNVLQAARELKTQKVITYIKENIPKHQYIDMPSLWRMMKDNGMKLAVHVHNGSWHDVGRMEDYMALTNNGEEQI